jgi:MoaA/NifB/PqqE/SkfB family radical SAM enzyme
MRRYTQNWQSGHLVNMVSNVRRRQEWFLDGASPGQLANLAVAGAQFALKQETMRALPVLLKVDISPACNLGCTFCVHASAAPRGNDLLGTQSFRGRLMPVADFARLVNEVRGRTAAVSLYYLGDPLVHPQLEEICGISRAAGLNTHISTNFSFRLSDDRIRGLVGSGLSHLTVCVDGMRQERYELTRVGGRIDRVLDNLDRLLQVRRREGRRYPKVEVQYIKFQHNLDDLEAAVDWCRSRGVDQFTDYWGNLHNYADVAPGCYRVFRPKPKRTLPRCSWPHFSLQVKYNGEVIPCCYYRHTEQYREGADARVVGNVLTSGVWSVWNSPAYRQLRRLVSDPTRANRDPALAETFCHGCPTVFETDAADHEYVADRHHWDELYTLDPNGRVLRR